MTLQASGAISLSQVNTELSLAATTEISLNATNVRSLAGVASGQISMSSLYGKSAGPPAPVLTTSSLTPIAVSLSWSNLYGVDLYTTDVYRNNILWAATSIGATTYTDDTASPNTAYTYSVQSHGVVYDEFENPIGTVASPMSNIVSVTTPSYPAYTGPNPEYSWQASSGLTIYTWTPTAGGLTFAFNGNISANSSTGAFFDGNTGHFATSGTLGSALSAKHIMVRLDGYNGGTLLGGTFFSIHEFLFGKSYIVEGASDGSTYTYAAQNALVGVRTVWVDFVNYAQPAYFFDGATTPSGYAQVYAGTYTNRFWWPTGQLYLGRRGQNDNPLRAYVKEVTIFTSSLTTAQGAAYRDNMISRWP